MAGTFESHEPEECPGPHCPDASPGFRAGTAIVEHDAIVMPGTKIWHFTVIRSGALIGADCNIGSHVIIGPEVVISDRCKIQDGAKIYGPCYIASEVFIGPNAVICNDRYPKAVSDWKAGDHGAASLHEGCSIGAGAVVLPGVRIGKGVIIPAGYEARRDVPEGTRLCGRF